MAIQKVLYALRVPIDLKRLLDSAAASGGVTTSQLVIDACWKYLERASNVPTIPPGDPLDSNPVDYSGALSSVSGQQPVSMAMEDARRFVHGQTPPDSMPVTREALKAICAEKIPVHRHDDPNIEMRDVVLCPKVGFNETDGESYRCSLAKGHKMNCRPGERYEATIRENIRP